MRFSRSEAAALFVSICLAPLAFGQGRQQPAEPQQNQSAPATSGQSSGNIPDVTATPQNAPSADELRKQQIDAIDPLAKPQTGQSGSRRNQASDTDKPPAQDTKKGNTGSGDQPAKAAGNQPLPGSIAESNLTSSREGPQVISSEADGDPQYNGPAVLSRTYTLQRPMAARELRWSWTIGTSQSYTTGLVSGPVVTGQPIPTQGSYASTVSFNFNGRHLWKHDQIGVNYSANYSQYTNISSYNGLNQTLSFDYSHMLSRHLELNIVETALTMNQAGTLLNPLITPGVTAANVNLAVSPTVQPLDATTRQTDTQVGLTWQKTARLSFSYSGGVFGVERTGVALVGNSGYQAQSDVNYRLTKKTTIGAAYAYTTYDFSHHFASAQTHTVGLIYSYAVGPSLQIRSRLGVAHLYNDGLTQMPVSPFVTALTGQQFVIVETRRTNEVPDISAEIVKDFHRRHTANLSYTRGIAPGNGIILTAIQESLGASFTTSMFRHYLIAFTGGRSTLGAALQGGNSYKSNYAGFSVTRTLPHNVSAFFNFAYRTYTYGGVPNLSYLSTPILPAQMTFSSGVTWGPGEGRIW